MPVARIIPDALKPFTMHGLDLTHKDGQREAIGECPFCRYEKPRLYVNAETGLWECKSCTASGNPLQFLRRVWEESSEQGLEYLAQDKGLLGVEGLQWLGAKVSMLSGGVILPGYNAAGEMIQLYRYAKVPGEQGRMALVVTFDMPHGLLGLGNWDASKPAVYICEGPWDTAALYEVMQGCKWNEEGGLVATGSESAALLAQANVIGVPSCGTFNEDWCSLFAGKNVYLLYDNDYPRMRDEVRVEGGGIAGMKRAASLLMNAPVSPREIKYLQWGEEGHDPELPSGFDVRDWLTVAGDTVAARGQGASDMLQRLALVPVEWKEEHRPGRGLSLAPCSSWKVLRNEWLKALSWTDGLEAGLVTTLSAVASTMQVGSSLWIKMIGPPSTGKTTLIEAVSVDRKYVFPVDSVSSLLSGYQADKEGTENQSLVTKIHGKTLAVKDADTILSHPNLITILSQFRAFYDRSIRAVYGNKMSQSHDNTVATVVFCGTKRLRALDQSELGERFLDVVIMEEMEEGFEHDVGMRVAYREAMNVGRSLNGAPESFHDPALLRAMQFTGGYVRWLREHGGERLERLDKPRAVLERCQTLGLFIAHMRAKPGKNKTDTSTAEREFSPRLIQQFTRLACCAAVVLNKRTIDEEVMALVQKVAMDTGQGDTLEVTKLLYPATDKGMEAKHMALHLSITDQTLWNLLRYLKKIGITETHAAPSSTGTGTKTHWRLTTRLRRLYREVTEPNTAAVYEGEEV